MINTKVKKPIELVSFENCISAFMRMPWDGASSWFVLAPDNASWDLVTGIFYDELEAHWINDKVS